MDLEGEIKNEFQILKEITFTNREKLTDKQIDQLLKTEVIKKKDYIIEIIPLIEKNGITKTIKFLEENKEKDFIEIIKNSSIHTNARRNYFLDLTSPLRAFSNIIDSFYKCPKCGSYKTIARQVQTRSADESSMGVCSCVCGHTWIINN